MVAMSKRVITVMEREGGEGDQRKRNLSPMQMLINARRACARGLQYSLCVCVCVCVCVSAVFWLHKMFIQHFDNGNRLCAKRERFSTHGFL